MNNSQALRPPARRLALIGTFLAVALVASLTVLPPHAPAEAQTSAAVSVGNLAGSTSGSNYSVFRRDSTGHNQASATAFTTGGSRSYRFTSVTIDVRNFGQGQLVVQIRAVNANGQPGAQIGGDLTGTIGAGGGLTTYTANGITLDGNTSYFLAIGPGPRPPGTPATTTVSRRFRATASDSEDSGSTSGWSIANTGYATPPKTGINTTQWEAVTSSIVVKFKVNAVDIDAIDGDSEYGWCLGRLSADACAEAIGRWEGEAKRVSPIVGTSTATNQGGGTTTFNTNNCPRTHLIRVATTNGIQCQQTYHPANPNLGPEIAPPSVKEDTWDGSPRGCNHQSQGYYNLSGQVRAHGLGKGCHTHGSGHHEHELRTH